VLQRDVCRRLFQSLVYRVKYLQKDFKVEFSDNGNSGVLCAVYCIVPNRTIQFLFIDTHYNQLSFNSLFIEKYKERLSDAYKFYAKVFKPRLTGSNITIGY